MKHIAPDYYGQFRCIAGDCRHSCCIGWEIDIDPASRERYRALTGDFGQRLNASIADEGDAPHFRLGPGERCPMLNERGLCDLILHEGEGALCQICDDHPRYRSYFADRTEVGLGLCCEAAARLILGRADKAGCITLADDGQNEPLPEEEAELLQLRAACIARMQDRSQTVEHRLADMLARFAPGEVAITPEWVAVHRDLERLDPAWDAALDLIGPGTQALPALEVAFEQFAVYLLWRHLPDALEDGDAAGRIRFAALSTRLLMGICRGHAARHGACTLTDCAEYARMWSAEIEYDEDNVSALLDALWED